jgi:hypothetical protein
MSKGDSLGGSNSLLYHGPSFTIENLPSLARFLQTGIAHRAHHRDRERAYLSALLRHTQCPIPDAFRHHRRRDHFVNKS